jgi:hypothetical protein
MKSIYFLLYFTRNGARHGVYAGAFARENSKLEKPKGTELWSGSTVPRVVHQKIRNLWKIPRCTQGTHQGQTPHEHPSRGRPDASMHLASAGVKIPLARGRPNTAGSSKTKATPIILRRRCRSRGPCQTLHLVSNPQRGVDELWALLSINAFASVRVQLPSRRGRPSESPRAAICS